MFAGIDIASERHTLVRLDDSGLPIGRPITFMEDREGYDILLKALGDNPTLIVMEATGHYWKNLFAALTAAGHDVAVLNPFVTRRFQDSSLERTKTDEVDAHGLARFGFEKRPAPSRLHDDTAESLRELVRHRDRLRQDFNDRVRQLHRLVDLGFPEFIRYVRSLDSMLATCLLAAYPTAKDFALATPRRLAKIRYDGRHFVGSELAQQLIAAAKRSIGQHQGLAYTLQASHICQDLDLWRRRLAELESEIERLVDRHEVGKLLTTIDGIGPQTAARVIGTVGDPARFRSAAAFAAYAGVVPGVKQSGKRSSVRAGATPFGNARLRMALWMPVLGAVRRNPWLRAFYERLRAAGKPAKLALLAAMRKLLHAIYSVAKNRMPFKLRPELAQAA
jgi:transposase